MTRVICYKKNLPDLDPPGRSGYSKLGFLGLNSIQSAESEGCGLSVHI